MAKAIKMSGSKEFFVVRLKNRPELFLKDVEHHGHDFSDAYLRDKGFWDLVVQAINDYENEYEVLRFDSVKEAEKAIYDLLSYLEEKPGNPFKKDSFEIIRVEALLTSEVVKTFDNVGAVLGLAGGLGAKMLRFETYFVGTPLGYKLNATKAGMKNARRKDFEGYAIESYDKHYHSWLELNDEL